MTKKRMFAVLAAVLLAATISAPASQAQTEGAGGVVFSGIANLPTFPCDPGPCSGGTFAGNASGATAGVHNGTPWTAAFANSTMTANFSYNEPAATCPAQGSASGSFTISGGTSAATYGTETGTARATGSFTWTRVGLAADVTTLVTVTITVPSGQKVIAGLTDRAVAGFAPLGVVHCDAPAPLQAAVAGVDILPNPTNP